MDPLVVFFCVFEGTLKGFGEGGTAQINESTDFF